MSLQDAASASEQGTEAGMRESQTDAPAGEATPPAAGFARFFPYEFCLSAAGLLAAFVGLVAVGTERRQKWAARFATDLFGTGQKRVRGYLKPIDPPGTNTARANIGLENPGLDSVKVGKGTQFIPAANALVEFIGTSDKTPPELLVEDGTVTVEGKTVTHCKLKDGDVIEIDGLRYQYLRGSRR